jgi:pSer/pThr/pTyr-binding forkhead associated (FHA) protein
VRPAADGTKLMVTDLGSTNGTEVNGEELAAMTNTLVPLGSEVTFGDMYLAKFRVAAAEE